MRDTYYFEPQTPAEREARLNEKVRESMFDEAMGSNFEWFAAQHRRLDAVDGQMRPVDRNTDLRDPRVTPWVTTPPTKVELEVARDLAKLRKIERKAQRGSLPYKAGRLCGTFWQAIKGIGQAFARVRIPDGVADAALFVVPLALLIGLVVLFSSIDSADHDRKQSAIDTAAAAVSACEHRLEMQHRLHQDLMVSVDEFYDRADDAKTKAGRERNFERGDDLLDDAVALHFPDCERQRDALYAAEDAS